MKLNIKDNIDLLSDCCVIKEIEYRLEAIESEKTGNNEKTENLKHKANEIEQLRNSLDGKNNFNMNDLPENLKNMIHIKDFIKNMQTKHKHLIQKQFFRRAEKATKQYYSSKDTVQIEKNLRDKFFKSKENLKNGVKKDNCKYAFVATIGATGALAGIALHFAQTSHNNVNLAPTPVVSEKTTNAPTPTHKTITSIENLDINDKDFDEKIINDFKSFYIEKYNSSNMEASMSSDDIIVKPNEFQNYIYKIKVGNEDRYISHGNQPQMIEQYFDNNNIKPEVIYDCESASVYSSDSNGNIQKTHDEFGNISDKKIDSAVKINGKYIKLYDGNNPKGFINPKSNSNSLLADMGDIVYTFTLSTNTENDRQAVKNQYLNNVEKYKESKLVYDCSFDNKIDEELEK